MKTIENQNLRVEIANHGAEIVSIFDKRTKRECVWNGDGSWWKRHTPVLFPIVGSIWHNTMRVDGNEYHMTQHGFARDMAFECIEAKVNTALFSLKSSAETKEKYPFDFELQIRHTLIDNKVITAWEVKNPGNVTLPFQIGGHPAYMIPTVSEDYDTTAKIVLSGDGKYQITEIGSEGCVKAGTIEFNHKEFEIRRDTFAKNAIIFEDPCPQVIELFDRDGKKVLTFNSPSPSLGIWAPVKDVHAPFVCIEPWWGRTDRVDYTGEFKDKEYMNFVEPGKSLAGEWSVEFE